MIRYRAGDPQVSDYTFSYVARRDDYVRYVNMSDEEFTSKLEYVLHFAIHICWVKEKYTEFICADEGILHELLHLLIERLENQPGIDPTRLTRTRELFKRDCELI